MNDQPLNPETPPAFPPPVLAVGHALGMTLAEQIAARPDGAPILSPLNQAEPSIQGDTTTPPPVLRQIIPPNRRQRRRRRFSTRAGLVPGEEAARIKAKDEADRNKKKAKAKATAKMKKRQRARG